MNNEPAFPAPPLGSQLGYGVGITIRDYFATRAMEGLLSYPGISTFPYKCAKRAYELADAMMKEREK